MDKTGAMKQKQYIKTLTEDEFRELEKELMEDKKVDMPTSSTTFIPSADIVLVELARKAYRGVDGVSVDGVSPDQPIVINDKGGAQSDSPYRMDLLDGPATLDLGKRLAYGAKRYKPNNWRKIPIDDHLNHALVHIYAYLSGDTTDDHLSGAQARIHFARALQLRPDYRVE